MRTPLIAAGLVACTAAPAAAVQQTLEGVLDDGYITNLDLLVGVRVLDEDWDDRGPAEHATVGLQYETRGIDWPVAVGLGLAYSDSDQDEVDELDTAVWEYWVGVYLPLRAGPLELSVGGGPSLYHVDIERGTGAAKLEQEETEFGVHASATLRWTIADWLNLGVQARAGFARLDGGPMNFDEDNVNPAGLTGTAVLGLRF